MNNDKKGGGTVKSNRSLLIFFCVSRFKTTMMTRRDMSRTSWKKTNIVFDL